MRNDSVCFLDAFLELTAPPSLDEVMKTDYGDQDFNCRQLVPEDELAAILALEVCR